MDVDFDASVKTGSSTDASGDISGGASAGANTNKLTNTSNIMAGTGTVPSVTISLHPLVIMNISEHWTRIRAQAGEACQVYGALIGKQKGRNIEVMNSFELKTDIVGDDVIINLDYYNTKEHQYKQVSYSFFLYFSMQSDTLKGYSIDFNTK